MGGGGGHRGGGTGGGRYPGGAGTGGGGRRGGGGAESTQAGRLARTDIVIQQSETDLKVTYGSEGKAQDFVQVFKLDGSESDNPAQPGGGEFKSRASWNKDKLVILGTQQPTGSNDYARNDVVVKHELSLSKDGKTLTLKTSRSSARGEVTTTETFNRRSEDK